MISTLKQNSCAVIPFFNESQTIDKVISETLNYVDCVIAIDDGSTDMGSSKISDDEKIILLKNSINRGKGYSLKEGLEKSVTLGYSYTVTLDADFQHPPQFIPDLLIALNKFDLVSGNRLKDTNKMPPQRILSNRLTSFLLSKKLNYDIKDSQCGFRAFKTAILKNILPDEYGYEAESEMIVKAIRNKYKIGFIDIPAIYGDEKSKMKSFQTIKGFLKVLFS